MGLPIQAAVLVVGASTGEEALRLEQERPGWRFTATDVSLDMPAIAQRHFIEAGIADRVRLHAGTLHVLEDAPLHDAALLIPVAHFIPDDGSRL